MQWGFPEEAFALGKMGLRHRLMTDSCAILLVSTCFNHPKLDPINVDGFAHFAITIWLIVPSSDPHRRFNLLHSQVCLEIRVVEEVRKGIWQEHHILGPAIIATNGPRCTQQCSKDVVMFLVNCPKFGEVRIWEFNRIYTLHLEEAFKEHLKEHLREHLKEPWSSESSGVMVYQMFGHVCLNFPPTPPNATKFRKLQVDTTQIDRQLAAIHVT